MSQECELPEFMAWHIIRRLEYGQTQSIGVLWKWQEVLFQVYELDSEKHVRHRAGQGHPHATTANNDPTSS